MPNIEALIPPEKIRGYFSQFEEDTRRDFDRMVREKLSEAGLPPELATLLPYDSLKAMGLDLVSMTERLIPMVLGAERQRFSAQIHATTGERIGILSVAENPTSLLMWAHYAASHHGLALEFDSSDAFFNQQRKPREIFGRLFPVTYATERPAITLYDPDAEEETWALRLIAQAFLTKSLDWSYEREWRMFLPLDDADRPHEANGRVHLFAFPPSALTGVILGARCEDATRAAVEKIVQSDPELDHVSVRMARISATHFEVLIGS
jgi:hypothetical protein